MNGGNDAQTIDSDFFLQLVDPERNERTLIVEQNDRVAYAYLWERGKIVADVWLHNVGDSPVEVNWRDASAMPFPNPQRFCTVEKALALSSASVVECCWSEGGVTLSVDNTVVAKLERGCKPGWSKHASVAGPLALPLACSGTKDR
jgi:hypothetical protein